MSTVIRPEVSKRNTYWISKHRYYELKHFCLQYPEWKKEYHYLKVRSQVPSGVIKITKDQKNLDNSALILRMATLSLNIELVERCCEETSKDLSKYLLDGVTKGYSYDYLHMKEEIPCCKDVYYKYYRAFFSLLDSQK